MGYPEDTANKHARRDQHLHGKWTCLCDACRAQNAIDRASVGQILDGPRDEVMPALSALFSGGHDA